MSRTSVTMLMASKKTEDRIRAFQRFDELTADEQRTFALAALHDKSAYIAALAADALTECADDSCATPMITRFMELTKMGSSGDPGCHIRGKLAFAFGRREIIWAVDALRVGIRTVQVEGVGGVQFDTGAYLRANCALSLAHLHAPDVLRDIALLLFDRKGFALNAASRLAERSETRKAAAQAMEILGDPNGLIPLTLCLTYPQDELPDVLQECMRVIVALEDPRAVEILRPYLAHDDSSLAAYAALMIAQTRSPEAPALLQEIMERLSGNPLTATVLALTSMRSEAAQEVLHSLAGHHREAVRKALAEAWQGTRESAQREILETMAKSDRVPAVRAAAKRALE